MGEGGPLTACDRGAMVSQLVTLLVGGGIHDGGLRDGDRCHALNSRSHASGEIDQP